MVEEKKGTKWEKELNEADDQISIDLTETIKLMQLIRQ